MASLSEKAMLVRLKRHIMYTSRTDRVVTDETTERKGSAKDAGSWTTHFLPKDCMPKVTRAASRITVAHETYTLPWYGDGTRVLPTEYYDKYMDKMNAAIAEFNEAVEEWLRDVYPGLRENASERLAGLFTTEISIPSVEEARTKFGIDHDVFPMPDSRDFRCYLGEQQLKTVQAGADAAIARLSKTAVADIYKKVTAMLKRIVTTLDKKEAKFKNSLINNLKDLCEMIPVLNLNDDPDLEKIRKQCTAQLTKASCDSLREDEEYRQQTADKAKKILESVRKIDLDIE